MQENHVLTDALEHAEARAQEALETHAAKLNATTSTLEAKMRDCRERGQMRIEDLRAVFFQFTERHSVSDAEHAKEVQQLREQLDGIQTTQSDDAEDLTARGSIRSGIGFLGEQV